MTKVAHISGWVMLVMGALILIGGIILGEWARAAQGALFLALGWYFRKWEPKEG